MDSKAEQSEAEYRKEEWSKVEKSRARQRGKGDAKKGMQSSEKYEKNRTVVGHLVSCHVVSLTFASYPSHPAEFPPSAL